MSTDNKEKNIVPVEQEEIKQEKITETKQFDTIIAIRQTFIVVSDKNGNVRCIEHPIGNVKIGDKISV